MKNIFSVLSDAVSFASMLYDRRRESSVSQIPIELVSFLAADIENALM